MIYSGSAGVRGGTTRLAMTYNGLTLNNPADTLNPPNTYEINTVVGQTALDYISELNQQRDGQEIYAFRKVNRVLTLQGRIRAPNIATLHDKIKALAVAFDPAKIAHDNDPTGANPGNMFLAFDFSIPTTDTTNYASGLVPSRYYALPLRIPDPAIDYASGDVAGFNLTLVMRDPRRYWQTQSTQTGAGTINNSLANYQSWPTLTITMAGAGSATYSVTNTTALHGAVALTLDLSGRSNGQVVVVDMERRTITVNGTSTPSLYVSGSYFHIDPVASNAITYGNTTNATSVLTYRRAWAI